MEIKINIDIETAKSALTISAGNYEQYQNIMGMDDEEIKDSVMKHVKCWGISEVK